MVLSWSTSFCTRGFSLLFELSSCWIQVEIWTQPWGWSLPHLSYLCQPLNSLSRYWVCGECFMRLFEWEGPSWDLDRDSWSFQFSQLFYLTWPRFLLGGGEPRLEYSPRYAIDVTNHADWITPISLPLTFHLIFCILCGCRSELVLTEIYHWFHLSHIFYHHQPLFHEF